MHPYSQIKAGGRNILKWFDKLLLYRYHEGDINSVLGKQLCNYLLDLHDYLGYVAMGLQCYPGITFQHFMYLRHNGTNPIKVK